MRNEKSMTTNYKIGYWSKHIDNGGPSIEITYLKDKDYSLNDIEIKMNTQYHGYTDIAAILRGWGRLGEKELKEIGLMFIEAAGNLNKLDNQKSET